MTLGGIIGVITTLGATPYAAFRVWSNLNHTADTCSEQLSLTRFKRSPDIPDSYRLTKWNAALDEVKNTSVRRD